MRKKLQVFVSSTYTDLRPERQAAVEAILSAKHIPAGMELFAAGDKTQLEVIKRWIDDSDVFLLILGRRYGSIEPTSGKSYIQLEYEHALNEGKPLFAIVEEEAINPDNRFKERGSAILEQDFPEKFQEFRRTVTNFTVSYWHDVKDIKLSILENMSEIAKREDLAGWMDLKSLPKDLRGSLEALADNLCAAKKNIPACVQGEMLYELKKFDMVASGWAKGVLNVDQKRYQSVLISLYEGAQKSIFSTTVSKYTFNWADELMKEMMRAGDVSKALKTRVFIFETRDEINERAIQIIRLFEESQVITKVYLDSEDKSFVFPPLIAKDFVVIDDGVVIGATTELGANFEAEWYFNDHIKMNDFKGICHSLNVRSIPAKDIIEWWEKRAV